MGREGSAEEEENPREDRGGGRAVAVGRGLSWGSSSSCLSSGSHPAPSRHLLRQQQQRVVFL